jgi:hypothetical protein
MGARALPFDHLVNKGVHPLEIRHTSFRSIAANSVSIFVDIAYAIPPACRFIDHRCSHFILDVAV